MGSAHSSLAKSSLLSLPRELRDEILDLVVQCDEPIVNEDEHDRDPRDFLRPQQPSITRTCRQLRHEGLILHYTHNAAHFHYGSKLPVFSTIEYIKHFDISIQGLRTPLLLDLRQGFTNYRVRLQAPCSQFGLMIASSQDRQALFVASEWMDQQIAEGRTEMTSAAFKKLLIYIRHEVKRAMDRVR